MNIHEIDFQISLNVFENRVFRKFLMTTANSSVQKLTFFAQFSPTACLGLTVHIIHAREIILQSYPFISMFLDQ